jgi:hypothetical protein
MGAKDKYPIEELTELEKVSTLHLAFIVLLVLVSTLIFPSYIPMANSAYASSISEREILDKLDKINESINQNTSNEQDIYVAVWSIGAAIVSSILTRFFYSHWKRPKLQIKLGNNIAGQGRIYLHSIVKNLPHSFLPIQRHAAVDTTIHLTFCDVNTNAYLFNREKIEGKWVSRPRCLTNGIFDESKIFTAHHIYIHCDNEGELFDTVLKNRGNDN